MTKARLLTFAEWDRDQWREGAFTSYYDIHKAIDKYTAYSREYRESHSDPDPTKTALCLWRELLEYEDSQR